MNKIAEHFKRHKVIYVGVGCFVAGATLAYFTRPIMREFIINSLSSEKAHINGHTSGEKAHINGHTVLNFFGDNNTGIVNVKERAGRGHPGYMIEHKETGLVYESQKKAARALSLNQTQISDHLNGRTPDVHGHHFERLMLAA